MTTPAPSTTTATAASGGTRPLILLTDPIHPAEMGRLERLGEVVRVPVAEPSAFAEQAARAQVLVVRSKLPADLFEHTPRMLGVVRHGSGVDLIPVPSATEKGIVVCNVPGANGNSVAEYCMAALLDAARGIHRIHLKLQAAGWETSRAMAGEATELAGKTIGIVGMGNIGTRLAQIAHHGFGMHVAAYRRGPVMNVPEHVEQVPLERLFTEADYICLCCPLNESTHGLVNARLLDRCKPGAWLVNVSRGEVVDQDALVQRLKAGRLRGATLDTFLRSEGFIENAGRVPGLVLTPHLAGLADESMRRMSTGALDAVQAILRADTPRHVVNPEVLDTDRCRLRRPPPPHPHPS